MGEIKVSIICNTFNQEEYIKDALESFVTQKTNFEYEVLVHDDASTDGTAAIIRQYEEKYPHLIKPIYQTQNQHSQRIGISRTIQIPRAKGKYIAFCEGDDYWIDEYKLQKQVDYMESHAKCTFCFTNGYTRHGDDIGKKVIPWDKHCVWRNKQCDFSAGEVELLGYIPAASFLFPRGLKELDVPPTAFRGDAFMKISNTYRGYAHFIDEPMVVYRRDVNGSATSSWANNKDVYAKQCDRFITLFESLKSETDHKYDDVFNFRKCQWKIEKNYALGNVEALCKIARSGELKNIRRGNFYTRMVYSLKCKHCKTASMFHKILKRLKGINK